MIETKGTNGLRHMVPVASILRIAETPDRTHVYLVDGTLVESRQTYDVIRAMVLAAVEKKAAA